MVRLLEQEGEDPVHVQRFGVPGHGAREAAEERGVDAVAAEQVVDQADQPGVRRRQLLRSQRAEHRVQFGGEEVTATEQFGFESTQCRS